MVVQYILKRLLWFIPVLLCVILLLFLLDQQTLTNQFTKLTESSRSQPVEQVQIEQEQLKMAKDKGWDLPPFYFTINHRGWSASYYQQVSQRRRNILNKIGYLALDEHATQKISTLIFELQKGYRYGDYVDDFKSEFLSFYQQGEMRNLWMRVKVMPTEKIENSSLLDLSQEIKLASEQMKWYWAFPQIKWHGKTNRFHRFLTDYFLSGTQKSVVDGRPIYSKIWPAAGITMFINMLALLILTLIGIPLGTYLFKHEGELPERIIRFALYVLYALPLFWLATVVLIMAGNLPGSFMTGTLNLNSGEIPSILTFLRPHNVVYILLPIFTIVVGLLAFIAIQMLRALQETSEEKYILAAHSRGLEPNYVTVAHNKPNALYSILTIIGNSIPQLISGSVVIEIIFNIPGMGRLLWNALYDFDWSLVTGILIAGVLFSIVGQLITDLAYYYVNPILRASS